MSSEPELPIRGTRDRTLMFAGRKFDYDYGKTRSHHHGDTVLPSHDTVLPSHQDRDEIFDVLLAKQPVSNKYVKDQNR